MTTKILVTGGGGSIATKLTRYLVGEGLRSGRRFEIVLVDDYDGFWNGEVSDPLFASRNDSDYPYRGYLPLDELQAVTASSIEHVSSTLQDGSGSVLDEACRDVDALTWLHLPGGARSRRRDTCRERENHTYFITSIRVLQ